ncbi:MAG: glutamate--cysteine ligase [Burkholderiaceae bacterium]|jgi:glutamate--cysteine ligase|nr:glutamate--cysteine ligase [Burkholderiaceae bacterium]
MSSNPPESRLPHRGGSSDVPPDASPHEPAGAAQQRRLAALSPPMLRGLRRGIEKESLRTRRDGHLSQAPHPVALGSALTHPHITTDFSEAQLELITGVHVDADACLGELTELHQFVYRHLDDEILWSASMPCGLPADDAIPLARYGRSNLGRAKTVYRQGLSHRYGRRMQTISGIHYNFSLPDDAWQALQHADGSRQDARAYRDASYFSLIRNFRRHSWLLLYLFGASPAVCSSFLDGHPHALQPLGSGTLYLPYATSLRMGPLGYQSDAQASLAVSFNCFDSYAASLSKALSEPYPAYESIGIHDGNGLYRQLATTLLQIENEFYGTIRPKRSIRPGERPLRALAERGVEYVEVRCLDIDPFFPVGIGTQTMRFLDAFLLHCLLADSPPDTPQEVAAISHNQHLVAQYGRDPAMRLRDGARERSLRDWGGELLAACAPIADALDAAQGVEPDVAASNGRSSGVASRPVRLHREALDAARAALEEPSRTPSARSLEELRTGYDDSFRAFALAHSLANRDGLMARPLDADAQARQERSAEQSLDEQRRIEASETMPFEVYRRRYLAGELGTGDAR